MLVYNKLKKKRICQILSISQNNLAKLSKNKIVLIEVLVKIFRDLNCIGDNVLKILSAKKRG